MEKWKKVVVVIFLVPFIYFMNGFIIAHPEEPSMSLKKTLNQAEDIYLNVSKGYEYRIILDPSANQYSPKKLAVAVNQNLHENIIRLDPSIDPSANQYSPKKLMNVNQKFLVVKSYVVKLDSRTSCYEGSCNTIYEYSPECAAFIPQQSGEIRISICVLEKGQDDKYSLKIYEGGSTESYRDLCSSASIYYYIFSLFTVFFILHRVFDNRSMMTIIIAVICIIICVVLLAYGISDDCKMCI